MSKRSVFGSFWRHKHASLPFMLVLLGLFDSSRAARGDDSVQTKTPIKHVVVIFQENRSFGCGYGTRLPFLVISPWAKQNYVDHKVTDQTSIIHFVEDNWDTGRIGDYSFDALAGSLTGFFDFDDKHGRARPLFLDPSTGQVEGGGH